ncbi:hypothetical protein [Micromonospora sp. DT31]|uniref:hypothetical protein n=1 Tax=Micromonospora sp. DT31 TaxID=3393434 RepID=UPI003CF406D6
MALTPPAGRRVPRPTRLWLVVAGLVAAGALTSGIVLLLAPDGELGQRFTPGQPVSVRLHPSSPQMVWAREADGVSSVQCEEATPGALASMTQEFPLSDVYELTVDGERWRGTLALLGSPADTYRLVCEGSGASGSTLSIGAAPWSYDLRHSGPFRMVTLGAPVSDTAIGSAMVILGTLAGLLVAVRVARRRRTLRQPDGALHERT